MNKNLMTSKQADVIMAVLKQFTANVAQAASEAISELEGSKAASNHTHELADISKDGMFSASGFVKLKGIESGAQKNTVTGIKGSAETSFRTGNINLTASNVGAAPVSHSHVTAGSTSIPSTGWKSDSNAKFPYYYDLSINGIAAADRVDLNVAIASMDIAITCGLCPTSEAFSGKVRIRAKAAPTAAISAEYWIMKK